MALPPDKVALGKTIREYLMANPEVLVEAMQELFKPCREIWKLQHQLDLLGDTDQGRSELELTALWPQSYQYNGGSNKLLTRLYAAQATLAARLNAKLPQLAAGGSLRGAALL